MQNKTKLVFLLSIIAILMTFNNVLAITEEYNPTSGADTTNVYTEFTSSDLSKFEVSDDIKYVILGSWPDGDYDDAKYLIWDDFGAEVPECIDVNNITLKFEWTKVGCMNIRAARMFIKTDSQDWVQVWEKTSSLPTSDVIETIDLTPYISDADDLESLQVKFQAWANLYGYSHHDWVEIEVDYDECPTHTECGCGYCTEVTGEGDDECEVDSDCRHDYCNYDSLQCDVSFDNEPNLPDECQTFIPDCGECLDDSYCDYLDDDYCEGNLVKHDEGICNQDFTCEVQTLIVEDCYFLDKYCDGTERKEDEGYCEAAQCETTTRTLNDCDNGQWCDGAEYCEEILGDPVCFDGTPPDCSIFDLDPVETCLYIPDGIDYTWDYFIGFTSQCDEINDECTEGEVNLTHECDIDRCDAECEDDEDCECPISECRGMDWYEYPAYGVCLDDCTCDLDETPCNGPCKPVITYNDPRCTHYICNYDQEQCDLVEGEGEDECEVFLPDCGECIDDSDCPEDYLTCESDTLTEHDNYCDQVTYTCEETMVPVEDCYFYSEQCSGNEVWYEEGYCDASALQCDSNTGFVEDCYYLNYFCDGSEIWYEEGFCNVLSSQCDSDSFLELDCDNGQWCDGAENCDNANCVPGTPIDCDDTIDCTIDSCDEINDECDHLPNDALCDDQNECTADYCDVVLGCVHDPIPDCCETNDDCDYLDDNYCNCYTGNFRMSDEGICVDNECTVETEILENCDVYDAWYYDGWETFTCYRSRDKEYQEWGCYEDNDETYCDYEITDTDTETENINEGMVCDTGATTCVDTCTIGEEQFTCQSGECAFDIWTNLIETDPFSCIDGQVNGCSTECGAECEDKFDCDCEEDHCVGADWYDYPDQGLCENDCTCNVDDTPCEGPCAPNIHENHPNCFSCVDNDQDGFYAIDPINCPEGDDCDDNDENVYPGAPEWCCDGVDNDCDGDTDCQDSDCWPSCEDTDNDGVPDCQDECIGENQQNLPSDTICREWFFNDQNGCHDYIDDDGSTICESGENSYYTCMYGDVYFVSETSARYCGVYTGLCDGVGTGGGGVILHDECGVDQYCVEGDDHCHSNGNNHDPDPEPEPEPKKETTSKKLDKGPSKGQSDFNINCGDGFCVIPQEVEDGKYYCPEDCGLMSWYQFN